MEKPDSDHVVMFINEQNHMIPSQESHSQPNYTHTMVGVGNQTKPPSPIPTRVQTLRRLSFSKPKARAVEFNLPVYDHRALSQSSENEPLKPSENPSPTDDSDEESEDDIEEEFEEEDDGNGQVRYRKKKKKIHSRALVEWTLFIIIMTCLICSLTISSLKNKLKWGLEMWEWCLIVMVIFSGRLVSGWMIRFLVFMIERNFMLKEKVLYFVYGLRRSFQNCVWLGLVLLAWTFMFNAKVHKRNKMLKNFFQALVAVLIGATIWLIKIVLVKVLASSFHVATYFDRMKESVFHHYVLNTLSGPPMDDVAYERAHHESLTASKSLPAKLPESKRLSKSKRVGTRRIDMERLRELSMQSRASAWSVKRLVNYVRSFGLSTISRSVDEFKTTEITSEWEARNCAKRIFKNVAKPGAK